MIELHLGFCDKFAENVNKFEFFVDYSFDEILIKSDISCDNSNGCELLDEDF